MSETLLYLKNLLETYLESEIIILKNKKTIDFKGVKVQGIIFPDWMNTNEADVMTLAVWNEKEIFYTEVDIVPPDSEEGIGYIYKLFTQKNFETRLYFSTRNELEGNLTIIDLPIEERESFAIEYKQKRVSEMYQHYNNILALEEEGIKCNIYSLPGFVRGFIGQGIIFLVKDFGCNALKLQIMSLEENVQLETEVAGDFDLHYPMYALNRVCSKISDCSYEWLGRFYFENGDLQKIEKIDYLKGEYFKVKQDLLCNCKRKLKKTPVTRYDFSKEDLKRIEIYLNTKFLPYQLGRLDANLKNLALNNDGAYVILLNKFSNGKIEKVGYFVWILGSLGFEFKEDVLYKYDEVYFIEDILNFLDGKIELYSNFWSYLEPGTNIYLWECLGANFINNDIVLKKFDYHFNLAKNGYNPRDFLTNLDILVSNYESLS